MSYQAHLYHLITTSHWPLFISFSLFSMAIFAVSYFHGFYSGILTFKLIINFCVIIYFYRIISLNKFNNYEFLLYWKKYYTFKFKEGFYDILKFGDFEYENINNLYFKIFDKIDNFIIKYFDDDKDII